MNRCKYLILVAAVLGVSLTVWTNDSSADERKGTGRLRIITGARETDAAEIFTEIAIPKTTNRRVSYEREVDLKERFPVPQNELRLASSEEIEPLESDRNDAIEDDLEYFDENDPSDDETYPEPDWSTSGNPCFKCSCGGQCRMCCPKHRFGFFVDAMYLKPGNADVVYAIEQTGCDPALSSPTGELGIAAPDFELGYRYGFSLALDGCNTIVASYSQLETNTASSIGASGNNVLASTVTHPSMGICAANSLFASALYDIDFEYLDFDLRHTVRKSCRNRVDIVGGLTWRKLQQEFFSTQTVNENGTTMVNSEIDFEGIGIRLGFDGNWVTCQGLNFYGRGMANLLGGEFRADYRQTDQFITVPIATDFEEYRMVSILETEVGVGWMSKCGRFSVRSGYQVTGWLDTITTTDFIQGVRTGALEDLGDLLTFSGFVMRAELRF